MVRSDVKIEGLNSPFLANDAEECLNKAQNLQQKDWSKETGKQRKVRSDVDVGMKNLLFTSDNVCRTLAILLKPFLCK